MTDFVQLLAYSDGEPVGFLQGEVLHRLDGGRTLFIYDLEVAEDHRRQGVGTELMRTALDHARERGVNRCRLITEVENAAARKLDESLDGDSWSAAGFGWTFGHP